MVKETAGQEFLPADFYLLFTLNIMSDSYSIPAESEYNSFL